MLGGVLLLVSSAAAQTLYPRGDADCSARLSAVDLVAAVRGAGGDSVCRNDDCDRDGVVTPADLNCAVGCLFGACPIPPAAPRALSVTADSAPRIVPLSAVHVTADHLGSVAPLTHVTIGNVEARIVGQPSPNSLLVVVPNLTPGPADVVIFDRDVAGFPLRIDVLPAVPIGAPDTFAGTLDLFDQVLTRFAALDLELLYGADASAVSSRLFFFGFDLDTARQRLVMDPTFTLQMQAQLDAAFEGSGVPEQLRQLLDDIDALQAGGTMAAVGNGGGAEPDFFTIAGIASTTAAVIGTVILAGGSAGLAPALLASLLVNGTGFLALEGTGVTAPKIFSANFFDASGEPVDAAVQRGMITLNGARMSDTSLVLSTVRREIVLGAQVSGNSFQQFRMPSDEYGLCGEAVLLLRRNLPPFAQSNLMRVYIKPELTQLLGPNPAAPGDNLGLGVHGVAGCEAFARFRGPKSAASALAEYRSNVEVAVPVPALLPGQYAVDLRVGLSETEERGLRVISPVTGLEVFCDRTTLHVFPGTPSGADCTARPLPVSAKVPVEFQVFRWTSSDVGTAFVTDRGTAFGQGQATILAEAPGSTAITATMPQLEVTSHAVTITVTDVTEPTVEVSAPAAVAQGGSLAVTVTATDNVVVSRIVLHASGDAVVNEEQEFPCLQLEKTCSAQFTVNIKDRDFTRREVIVFADAFDGSGNLGTSNQAIVRVTSSTPDTSCPQLTIQSPANGSTVNAAATVTVVAQGRDDQPGDTGILKFNYSATGAALVADVGPRDLTFPQPLPATPTLRFNFQVKSAADLASVTNRTIIIRVQAFDNAMPALDCGGPQIISVTAGAPPTQCGTFPGPFPQVAVQPHCDDPNNVARLEVQPAQGVYGAYFTYRVTITGPAAAQVTGVFAGPFGGQNFFLASQPDGSFQSIGFFPSTNSSHPVSFVAINQADRVLCCGGATVTAIGPCSGNGDCGTGQFCNLDPEFTIGKCF